MPCDAAVHVTSGGEAPSSSALRSNTSRRMFTRLERGGGVYSLPAESVMVLTCTTGRPASRRDSNVCCIRQGNVACSGGAKRTAGAAASAMLEA